VSTSRAPSTCCTFWSRSATQPTPAPWPSTTSGTLDLTARLVDHAHGRGARLLQVLGEQRIGWQLARTWTGTRARERSLKQRGATRRCPVCRLAALGLQPPRPVDPLALELGVRVAGVAVLVPPFELPPAVAA
jgi:hypothetical protein